MLCDICRKNTATVHLTDIAGDSVKETHICQVCAKQKNEQLKEQLNVTDFLGGTGPGEVRDAAEQSLRCTACGLYYRDFKKNGRLGCENCYTAFKIYMQPLLKKVHGSARHTGKAPFAAPEIPAAAVKLDELQARLKRAIQLEEYEEAARVRDLIRQAEDSR